MSWSPPGPNGYDGHIVRYLAQNLGRNGGSAIDGRTTRHLGYAIVAVLVLMLVVITMASPTIMVARS
jgi:hypothetical protein